MKEEEIEALVKQISALKSELSQRSKQEDTLSKLNTQLQERLDLFQVPTSLFLLIFQLRSDERTSKMSQELKELHTKFMETNRSFQEKVTVLENQNRELSTNCSRKSQEIEVLTEEVQARSEEALHLHESVEKTRKLEELEEILIEKSRVKSLKVWFSILREAVKTQKTVHVQAERVAEELRRKSILKSYFVHWKKVILIHIYISRTDSRS